MTTTYTQYNDAVAYDAAIRYDGVVTTPDAATPVDTGNRHAARPWPAQRGRSNTFRRAAETPRVVSGVTRIVLPKPEVTISRTIEKIILAPDKAAAEAKLVEFVADRNRRQELQPELPVSAPTQTFTEPPKLPAETAGEQAGIRHQRRQRDDDEVAVLVGLLEGF